MSLALPGRGIAIAIAPADEPDTPARGISTVERGCVVDGLYYQPVMTTPPTISRAFQEPLRGLPSWDRFAWAEHINPADYPLSDMHAARVIAYRETEGDFDPATDVLWRGRVMRGGASRRGYEQRVEGIDDRGFALDGATLPRRRITEELYEDAAPGDLNQYIPICRGDFRENDLAVRSRCLVKNGWVDGNPGTADPTYIYQDTYDLDGNVMATTASGFTVYYYDSDTYASPRDAFDKNGFVDITAHVLNHDHTEATFEVDVSAVGITWDVKRHIVLAQFAGAVSNDATLTAAATLTPSGPASILATHYVEDLGLDADLIDATVIEALDAKSPPVAHVYSRGESLAGALGSLLADLFTQERVTPSGDITWRTRWDFVPLVADVTVRERHFAEFPSEQLTPFDPFFTTLTVEAKPWPFATDEIITSGAVTDELLVAENSGQDVPHTYESKWLIRTPDLVDLAHYMLRTRGVRAGTAVATFRLDDADLGDQDGIQPGDVLDLEFPGVFTGGDLKDALAVKHDTHRSICSATVWVQNDPLVLGGLTSQDPDSAETTTTSAVGSAFVLLDGWFAGMTGGDANVEEDPASNVVRILYGGRYSIAWASAFSGDAGTYEVQVGKGTSAADRLLRSEQQITIVGSAVEPAGTYVIWDCEAGDEIGLYIRGDSTSMDVALHSGQLLVRRVFQKVAV